MSYHVSDLASLVIAVAGSNSNAITGLEDAEAVTIYAPAALTGTVTIQVEPTRTGTSYVPVREGTGAGTAATIAASTARTIGVMGARQLRVSSDGAEAAERTFVVVKKART